MSDIKVYMSPIEPSVISVNLGEATGSSDEENEIIINLVPVNQSSIEVTVPLLRSSDNYITALWPGGYGISWERAYQAFTNTTKVAPMTGIFIYFDQPHGGMEIRPWWTNSVLYARNPRYPSYHVPYIVAYSKVPHTMGMIPEDQLEEDYWQYTYQNSKQLQETQPIVRPGEYITGVFYCYVKDKIFYSPSIEVKYETPLFTGGWITAKYGTGALTRYSVEIFGKEVHNIIPTDFYDYVVGKWVYLMKTSVTLTLDEKTNYKQMYGSAKLTTSPGSDFSTVFNEVNSERVKAGLEPLTSNDSLQAIAQAHAEDMAANAFVGHTGSNGSTSAERFYASSYLNGYDYDAPGQVYIHGENVAGYQNPDEVTEDWMNSPGHKANILFPDYAETGIGIAQDVNGYYYFAQEFGYRSDSPDGDYSGVYRIVPFNFKGPMNSECAVPYEDAIQLSSSLHFNEVFDMINYEGEILEVYTSNDTAKVSTSDGDKTLPIFYYCDGTIASVEGGSAAFNPGDKTIIEVPDNDWDQAKIIGFIDDLKECKVSFALRPIFNGVYATHGGQHIYAEYTYNGVGYYLWFDIAGDFYTPQEYSVTGYSNYFEMEGPRFQAFKETAKFYLTSEPGAQLGSRGATHNTYYLNGETADTMRFSQNVNFVLLGRGDGTTNPSLSNINMGEFQYGIASFEIVSENMNGSIQKIHFNRFGFRDDNMDIGIHNIGQIDMQTGNWIIYPEWVEATGSAIIYANFKTKANYDMFQPGSGDTYYTELCSKVWYKESDNNMLTASSSPVIFVEGGVNKNIIAFEIEFPDLYMLRRTPNIGDNSIFAIDECAPSTGTKWHPSIAEICYGDTESAPWNTSISGWATYNSMGYKINYHGKTYLGNIPSEYYTCPATNREAFLYMYDTWDGSPGGSNKFVLSDSTGTPIGNAGTCEITTKITSWWAGVSYQEGEGCDVGFDGDCGTYTWTFAYDAALTPIDSF